MAYLFQSGSLEVQLSGGMDVNYSDVTSDKRFIIDASNATGLGSPSGSLLFGEGQEAGLYYETDIFSSDVNTGGRHSFKVNGTEEVAIDASSLDLGSGNVYKIAGTNVLTATQLGANVVGSSLTSLGVIGALSAGTVTATGIVKTDDTTEATSTTDGSLQTDGGLSVAKSAVIGDDLDLLSDGAILNIGSTSKFTLTDQAANNCVMAAAAARLAFGNAGEYISGDGTDLDIVSSGDLDIAATLVDITGALTVSGLTTASGRVVVDDATDATSKTDGSLQTDGGLSVAKKAYVGTGLTVEAGGVTVTAGGVEVDAGVVNIDDTTAATSKTTGALKVAGGISSQLKLHAGTGITTDSGGVTVTAGGVTVTAGRVTLDDTTDATSGTDGSLQTDGGLSVAKDAYIGNDLLFASAGVINFDSGDVTLTHSNDVLTIAGTSSPTLTATLTNALECDTAESGLTGTDFNGSAGVSDWKVDLNDLAGLTVDPAADGMAFIDFTDGLTKKAGVAGFCTAIAGSGITATNGVLSVSADSTSIQAIAGDNAAATLAEGMNYGSSALDANRTWTLPAASSLVSAGDIVRIKAAPLAGFTLTIAVHATDQVDDLANGADLELQSDNASITLQCVDATASAGKWRII